MEHRQKKQKTPALASGRCKNGGRRENKREDAVIPTVYGEREDAGP